jgi:uncharacterized protein YaeQ
MALKSTIFKAELKICDMTRGYGIAGGQVLKYKKLTFQDPTLSIFVQR